MIEELEAYDGRRGNNWPSVKVERDDNFTGIAIMSQLPENNGNSLRCNLWEIFFYDFCMHLLRAA